MSAFIIAHSQLAAFPPLDWARPSIPEQGVEGFREIDWEYWISANEDVIGWITVPGTRIDGPIVQADPEDPGFYLGHDVWREASPSGCFYLDPGCKDLGLAAMNAPVFGHNMSGGGMFADLASYEDGQFAEAHSAILLQTPGWRRIYHVAFVENSPGSANTKMTEFESREEFGCWLQERYGNSCVRLAERPVGDALPSSMVTLCTCSNGGSDERTLVFAYLDRR